MAVEKFEIVFLEINSKMMRDYSAANIPAENLGSSPTESVGVHFRCGEIFSE